MKIIELGGKLQDAADLADRVAALEELVKGQTPSKPSRRSSSTGVLSFSNSASRRHTQLLC